jgi:hypothetical protein
VSVDGQPFFYAIFVDWLRTRQKIGESGLRFAEAFSKDFDIAML